GGRQAGEGVEDARRGGAEGACSASEAARRGRSGEEEGGGSPGGGVHGERGGRRGQGRSRPGAGGLPQGRGPRVLEEDRGSPEGRGSRTQGRRQVGRPALPVVMSTIGGGARSASWR